MIAANRSNLIRGREEMKVAVFGGTGYVGSYLIDGLIEHDHQPAVLVRPAARRSFVSPSDAGWCRGTSTTKKPSARP